MGYTQLSEEFKKVVQEINVLINDRAAIALSAIRTCYSPNRPSEIVSLESEKYFASKASDGKSGTEADRLFRHIACSGHTSTLEHLTYTFAIEGVSRALLAQLTRHRHFSYSVQSQRYVRMGSQDKSNGFGYIIPPSIVKNNETGEKYTIFKEAMDYLQEVYDNLREYGVPAEDARMVLPNAATCNIVLTGNLRSILEFYKKRKIGNGAQWEITDLAENIISEILKVDEWLTPYFKK